MKPLWALVQFRSYLHFTLFWPKFRTTLGWLQLLQFIMELAGLVVTNPAIYRLISCAIRACWGGKKKASRLSDLEPPSPSLKLVVRHRDTSFKWGPSGFDKRIFCQSSCARDLGFFSTGGFWVLDGMDRLVDEWEPNEGSKIVLSILCLCLHWKERWHP